ncbi:MAG TPA: hypothetical protein VNE39_17335, partial [Planctomycetota bacterium]|nr:hypothetical protein [Planctomycetota bacterium]
ARFARHLPRFSTDVHSAGRRDDQAGRMAEGALPQDLDGVGRAWEQDSAFSCLPLAQLDAGSPHIPSAVDPNEIFF